MVDLACAGGMGNNGRRAIAALALAALLLATLLLASRPTRKRSVPTLRRGGLLVPIPKKAKLPLCSGQRERHPLRRFLRARVLCGRVVLALQPQARPMKFGAVPHGGVDMPILADPRRQATLGIGPGSRPAAAACTDINSAVYSVLPEMLLERILGDEERLLAFSPSRRHQRRGLKHMRASRSLRIHTTPIAVRGPASLQRSSVRRDWGHRARGGKWLSPHCLAPAPAIAWRGAGAAEARRCHFRSAPHPSAMPSALGRPVQHTSARNGAKSRWRGGRLPRWRSAVRLRRACPWSLRQRGAHCLCTCARRRRGRCVQVPSRRRHLVRSHTPPLAQGADGLRQPLSKTRCHPAPAPDATPAPPPVWKGRPFVLAPCVGEGKSCGGSASFGGTPLAGGSAMPPRPRPRERRSGGGRLCSTTSFDHAVSS